MAAGSSALIIEHKTDLPAPTALHAQKIGQGHIFGRKPDRHPQPPAITTDRHLPADLSGAKASLLHLQGQRIAFPLHLNFRPRQRQITPQRKIVEA